MVFPCRSSRLRLSMHSGMNMVLLEEHSGISFKQHYLQDTR